MKKEILITLVAALAVVAIVGNTFAWDGCGGKGKGMGMGSGMSAQGCAQEWSKLTDEQKNRVKELHQTFLDETATQREAILSKHEEIKTILGNASPDKDRINALIAEVSELQKQIMDKKIDMALQVKDIAPDINLGMGFHGFGKKGCCMMGDCGAGMKDGHGRMKGGHGGMMGKMNCPAMSSSGDVIENSADTTESKTKE